LARVFGEASRRFRPSPDRTTDKTKGRLWAAFLFCGQAQLKPWTRAKSPSPVAEALERTISLAQLDQIELGAFCRAFAAISSRRRKPVEPPPVVSILVCTHAGPGEGLRSDRLIYKSNRLARGSRTNCPAPRNNLPTQAQSCADELIG
jgi:hypothetical protein